MKLGAGVMAAAMSGAIVASSVCVSAEAAEPTETTVVVTKVVRKSSSKAKVVLTLTCPRLSTYSLSLEVLEDKTPNLAPLDAYYTGTKSLEGRCSGHKKRFSLKAKADKSGSFAPAGGRLTRGSEVDVVLGGSVNDEFTVLSTTAKVH